MYRVGNNKPALGFRGILFFIVFLMLASFIMSPRPAVADITKCSDLGSNWADGSCRPGMGCGFSDYCVCNIPVEQFGELCCRDTTSGVDHCYTKAGIEDYAGSESTNPADATYVNPNSSGTLTAEDKKEPVFFIPQFTLPGSKFIAGQSVQVDGNTLGDYITALYVFFVGVAGILSVVMMIYGGIKYTISFGSPQKLSDARDSITSAMIGLAIALGSYVILLTISPRLVTFQGLSELGSGIGPPLEFEELQQNSVKYGVSYKPVTQNVSTYDAQLLAVVDNDKYLASWLKAIMLVESSGNPQAESKDKYGNTLACGLMQLLPSTAGVSCAELKNNPTLSIQKAWQYFQELLANTCPTHALYKSGATAKCYPEKTNCTDGKFHYAVAAYNGGRGANCSSVDCPGSTWWECEANTGFAETRNYVAKVEDTYNKIQNDPAFAWSQ